jgi:uncharacterized membrane protein
VSWRRIFRGRLYVRDSLWVLLLAGALLGVLLGLVDVRVDETVHLPPQFQYSPSTASTVLAAIVGATAALTGFVVTVTTLVVQMATGTFSARYMRLWYRDRILKVLLALLVGTLAFSFSLMRRVETNFVPNLGVTIAGVLLILSLLVFLVFLDRYLHRLRPVAVAALVHGYFRRNFEYEVKRAQHPDVYIGILDAGDEDPSLTVRSARPGAIQAVDGDALVGWAQTHDCLVVLRHAIGDFVPLGARLIDVYGVKPRGRAPSTASPRWWRWVTSARSSRIPRSRSGSSSTLPISRCRPPSTTPRRRCRYSTIWERPCVWSAPRSCRCRAGRTPAPIAAWSSRLAAQAA